MRERYNVDYPQQSPLIRETTRRNNKAKYGKEETLGLDWVQAKCKESLIKNLGVDNPLKNAAIKEKAHRIHIANNGGLGMASPKIKVKIQAANLKNNGAANPAHFKITNKENFNAPFITQNFIINGELQEPEARNYFNFQTIKPILKLLDSANAAYTRQPKGTRGQRDFFYHFLQIYNVKIDYERQIKPYRVDGFIHPNNFTQNLINDFKIPQNSKGLIIEYLGDYWHGNLRYYKPNGVNPKTSKKHIDEFEYTFKRFDDLVNAGYSILYIWESDYSKFGLKPLRLYADYGKIISNFLDESCINFTKNNDIFSIPEYSLELYIHRFDAYPKYTKKGIYNITKQASARGGRVIHIFEQYIKIPQKFEILKNIILHACGKTKHRIYARNLKIEVKKSPELKDFFNENNIAGHRGAEFGVCLMQGNEIIMAYSIGKPFFGKGKYDAEIVRGACKIGYSVIGGASKIWNYLIKNYNYNSIVYYVDLNCYNGQSMNFLEGCEYIGEKPGFWNYWVETQELKNREPSRHAEIMQKTRTGEIITITNAGTQVNVWYRSSKIPIPPSGLINTQKPKV